MNLEYLLVDRVRVMDSVFVVGGGCLTLAASSGPRKQFIETLRPTRLSFAEQSFCGTYSEYLGRFLCFMTSAHVHMHT